MARKAVRKGKQSPQKVLSKNVAKTFAMLVVNPRDGQLYGFQMGKSAFRFRELIWTRPSYLFSAKTSRANSANDGLR